MEGIRGYQYNIKLGKWKKERLHRKVQIILFKNFLQYALTNRPENPLFNIFLCMFAPPDE